MAMDEFSWPVFGVFGQVRQDGQDDHSYPVHPASPVGFVQRLWFSLWLWFRVTNIRVQWMDRAFVADEILDQLPAPAQRGKTVTTHGRVTLG